MADRPAAIHQGLAPVGFVVRQQRAIAPRRARLLMINSGTLLISAAWSVIIIHSTSSGTTAGGGRAFALVTFLLFLLGVSLVMVALVAYRFRRAAAVGVAIARALRRYLLGLGW
ncbi:hypothetical protein BAE44_0010678 [Dichanthelium oligosanthes]|uniref:Uncharacterized protein n=1 Tax=Dichanthelium oligosanthes TaxID=888268 RepID=A0A1E5VT56_9POAL|nr:hypothetical protein BAE44_0010678 [Dichanthelium oligosanthes]